MGATAMTSPTNVVRGKARALITTLWPILTSAISFSGTAISTITDLTALTSAIKSPFFTFSPTFSFSLCVVTTPAMGLTTLSDLSWSCR